MKRHGALIIFKPGTTKEEAAKALASIANVLDFPAESCIPVRKNTPPHGRTTVGYEKVPFKPEHVVQEYESDHGSPVFYIP